MKKRILSILLLCCMVLTMLPAPAFAADEEAYALPPDTGGLCEHHPEHDEACGYTPQTEDVAGTPCGHVCENRESCLLYTSNRGLRLLLGRSAMCLAAL